MRYIGRVLGLIAAEEVEIKLCGPEVGHEGRVWRLASDGVWFVFVHLHGVVDVIMRR